MHIKYYSIELTVKGLFPPFVATSCLIVGHTMLESYIVAASSAEKAIALGEGLLALLVKKADLLGMGISSEEKNRDKMLVSLATKADLKNAGMWFPELEEDGYV